MVIAMLAILVTILEIFTVPMWVTLTLPVRQGQGNPGPRSNVNLLFETSYATLYLLPIAMFAIVTVCEILTVEMCVTLTLTLTFRMVKGKMYICQLGRPYATLYLLAIVMFAIPVAVLKILSRNVHGLNHDL